MIQLIKNQPIAFHAKEAEVADCGDTSRYCQMVRLNDKMCFQLRQKSCLAQLLCNNDFSIFGTDVLDGAGAFTTQEDYDLWTSDPDTWEWDSYGRMACAFEGHAGSPLQWDIDPYGVSEDCTYILEFTISGHDDDAEISNDILEVSLPDGTLVNVTTNGTYSYASGSGTSFKFTPDINWIGCVDSVTLKCSGTCWDITSAIPEKTGVILSGEGLCKSGLLPVTVTEQTGTLQIGEYYYLTVEISGLTQGSAEFFLGTTSIGTVDENGIFALSGDSNGTEFSFVMDGDFDGCVVELNLYQLSKEYTLKLKNSANDAVLTDLTDRLVYTNDLIEACVLFDEDMLGDLVPSFVNNEICLYLELESPADGDVVTNGTFTVTNSAAITDEWTFELPLLYEAIQGRIDFVGGAGYMYQDISLGGYVQGNDYYVSFDIVCYDHDDPPAFDSFTAVVGAAGDRSGGILVWDSTNFPQEVGHYVYRVTGGTDGDLFAFYFDDSFGANKICIDNLQIRTTACEKELYQSNCLKYMNENEGVKGWNGSKLFTACNEEGESMGFDWSTGFKLQSRLFASIVAPRYTSKEDETYLFSDGTRKRIYADLDKRMDLLIDGVDEFTHDYIRTMLKCDILFIDTDYTLTDRYICLDNDYVPEWDKKGQNSLAEARTEIQKWDNTIFNTNCK